MFLIYIAISLDKSENRYFWSVIVIAVTAAVTTAVLVVVGSVLSTQNG